MLETIFWFALGAFVGWNFPQPALAKRLQEHVVSALKNKSS